MDDDRQQYSPRACLLDNKIHSWTRVTIICRAWRISGNNAELAQSQDVIGWQCLLEGRVSYKFYLVQRHHLAQHGSRMSGDNWMHGFISRLIHISHSQWLLWNFTLHDQAVGFCRLKDKATLLLKIDELQQFEFHPSRVPEHSQFLLEINTDCLIIGSINTQAYLVAAMEAAWGEQSVCSAEELAVTR